MNAGTLPPHSPEAEEAVLGCVLYDDRIMSGVIVSLLPDEFFLIRNCLVYKAMVALYERGDAPDLLAVTDELRRTGHLDEIGGADRLFYIQAAIPTALHIDTYVAIVHRCYVRREVMRVASAYVQAALADDVEIYELLKFCQDELSNLVSIESKQTGRTSADLVSVNMDEWDRRQTQDGGIVGYPTGSDQLDVLIGGLAPGRTTFLGGRPKIGKTSAQLAILLNVAQHLHKTQQRGWCYFFSLEMASDDITSRLLSAISHIPLSKLSLAKLTDEENQRYLQAAETLRALNIYVDDTPGLSVRDIANRLRVYSLRYGAPALVGVDYVQILRGGRSHAYNGDNRPTEVEDAAYGLSGLAKEYHCHFISGAQVKQDVDQRSDKRPMSNDLANSDGIVRAASHVITLYRPAVYNSNGSASELEWLLVANRHGEVGKISDMRWNPACACMEPKPKSVIDLVMASQA
jgi:replicative DNA helicase